MIIKGVYYNGSEEDMIPFYNTPGDWDFALPNDGKYTVSLDQSTSCCGFYMVCEEHNRHLVLDLLRGPQDPNDFMMSVDAFLCRMVRYLDIELILHEALPKTRKYVSSGRKLSELIGIIKSAISRTPELQRAKKDSIPPQSWMSCVVDKSKGVGRFRDKRAHAEDICDIHPWLKDYFQWKASKDYDAFEAIGIYIGYKRKTTDAQGNQQVAVSSKSYMRSVNAYASVMTRKEYESGEGILRCFDFLFKDDSPLKVELIKYNERYSFVENITISLSCDFASLVILENPILVLNLCWEFNISYYEGLVITMLTVPRKLAYSGLFRLLEQRCHVFSIEGII